MRLLLFSDLHLDTTFAWAPVEVGRQRRANIRETLRNIIQLADEVNAEAICSAGDLYEHEHFTPETARFLEQAFNDAGRLVLLAPGNHDPLLPGSIYATAGWSDNVHVIDTRRLEPAFREDGFTLWAAAHHVTAGTPGFLDGFTVEGGGVHYALFHGSAEHALAREGDRKQAHAPFTVAQIERAGLHHALVGHYHTPDFGPLHTYPGNPDPLTFGEQGERGAVVVDVADDGTPVRVHHDVAVSKVHDLVVDVTGASTGDEVTEQARAVLEGHTGQVRLTLEGDLAEDVDLAITDLRRLTTPDLFVLPRIGRIGAAYDLDALETEPTVRGEFVRSVRADPELDDELRRRILTTGLRALEGRADLEVL